MEPHIADLIDALPEEPRDSPAGVMSPSLSGLLREMAGRPAPVGRFHRARILGTLQAKIAVAYLAYWIRTSYKGVEEKQQRLNETHLKAALELLRPPRAMIPRLSPNFGPGGAAVRNAG